MSSDFERLRHLLLEAELGQLQHLQLRMSQIGETLADELERQDEDGRRSRLNETLSELTAASLEVAVRRRPHSVVEAMYPVIGATIRRALSEALRQIGEDLDRALEGRLSPRALWWRWLAWRDGVPYAQVALRHSARHRVEHLFLIQRGSGLLLGHLTATGLPALDADAVAGMFSAIHQFVHDSVIGGDGESGAIGSASVGDYRLVVSEGPWCWLVAFVRGAPPGGFGSRLDGLNERLHSRYGRELADPAAAGQAGAGRLEQLHLEQLNPGVPVWQSAQARRRRGYVYAAALVLLLVWLANAALSWRWSMQADALHTQLSAWPGLSLSHWDASQRGRLRIDGLLDPLADAPPAWLARRHPGVAAEWRLRPFVSLDPLLVRRRLARSLSLPLASVPAPTADGTVKLVGSVPFADWQRLQRTPSPLPGVRLDTAALTYPGSVRIATLVAEVQDISIEFDRGTVQPSAGMEQRLDALLERLQALQQAGAQHAIGVRLAARGFTDDPGSYVQNRDLRLRRAEWLATQLMAQLAPPTTITLDQEAISTLPYQGDSRATSLSVTLFAVEP